MTATRPFGLAQAKAYRIGDVVWVDHIQLELDVEVEEIDHGCDCPSCRDTAEYGYARDDEDEDQDEDLVTLDTFNCGGGVRTEHASAMLMPSHGRTEMSVWSVRVDEGFRGQGYGRQLMQHVCQMADRHNYSLWLQVYVDNAAAIRLYESVGFVVEEQVSTAWADPHFVMRRPDRQLCLVATTASRRSA